MVSGVSFEDIYGFLYLQITFKTFNNRDLGCLSDDFTGCHNLFNTQVLNITL